MKKRIVKRTSVFPADTKTVFMLLQQFETLQKIAWPYATFTPIGSVHTWKPQETCSFSFRLFGLFPMGTHTIHVLRFSMEEGIYTEEGNPFVPVWNHEICLCPMTEDTCEYTDRVEIQAGWKTGFVTLWAQCFYRHRQKKWIRLLKKK